MHLNSVNALHGTILFIFQVRKRKVKVLDEDEFVEKVEKIIERDFFPGTNPQIFIFSFTIYDSFQKRPYIRMRIFSLSYLVSLEGDFKWEFQLIG